MYTFEDIEYFGHQFFSSQFDKYLDNFKKYRKYVKNQGESFARAPRTPPDNYFRSYEHSKTMNIISLIIYKIAEDFAGFLVFVFQLFLDKLTRGPAHNFSLPLSGPLSASSHIIYLYVSLGTYEIY